MLYRNSLSAISKALKTRILIIPETEYRAIGLGMQNILILTNHPGNKPYRADDILVLCPDKPNENLSQSFRVRIAALHRFEDLQSAPPLSAQGRLLAELASAG